MYINWRINGLLVTIPVPRGRILLPTKLSITELLPELWDPTITIWGSWMASAPTVLKTSCSLLMTGMRDSIKRLCVGLCVEQFWKLINEDSEQLRNGHARHYCVQPLYTIFEPKYTLCTQWYTAQLWELNCGQETDWLDFEFIKQRLHIISWIWRYVFNI